MFTHCTMKYHLNNKSSEKLYAKQRMLRKACIWLISVSFWFIFYSYGSCQTDHAEIYFVKSHVDRT
ncbi:hypothetical protein T11_8450 [Trichinella zimbabwensis]|uniref:Uncharacterized protein n=1 Tax=Trichinella zimbabwensis TaxID=268475 RepID=A0A0V1HU27_9BILA|nr:hypothetical protein T11_8450 [Trichinella zimbabwensis]